MERSITLSPVLLANDAATLIAEHILEDPEQRESLFSQEYREEIADPAFWDEERQGSMQEILEDSGCALAPSVTPEELAEEVRNCLLNSIFWVH